MFGSDFDDTLIGGGDDFFERFEGSAGNDFIDGATGFDDTLIGGADDFFEAFLGWAGNDFIDGGTGFDDASYSFDPAGVTVNLLTGTATDGFGDTDTLRNIEGVIASEFDDLLTGSALDNDFFGLGGFDVLYGGAGNDFIDGGLGIDAASYSDDPAKVTVNLSSGTATDGFGNSDTLFLVSRRSEAPPSTIP